ncbi:hypothetical protein OG765_00205 [Streptomyces sp. NBC_00555]|uniref:hypothetical protein n=1 Tax=Streptomyces sp. NBC_00555 TaxID=2903662 RepID=UPI00225303E0|nr:hypothetical protein [Streptomyces sp. NBC_00555]MCX5009439.1 hypothetical protein [Streptomyces sp. NBC_00555]
MTGRRFTVGDAVFDSERQARGEVVGLYSSPLVVRLADAGGFHWIARTVACERAGERRAAGREPGAGRDAVRVPPGHVAVDCPPTELRVGDQVHAGGRLVAIADLRYRHGATRTMVLRNGAVCVAERTIRVYRPHTAR